MDFYKDIERIVKEYSEPIAGEVPHFRVDGLIMADLGVNPDSYSDFIEDISSELSIKSLDDVYVSGASGPISRIYRRWKRENTLHPPDLTPDKINEIAQSGFWPKAFHHSR